MTVTVNPSALLTVGHSGDKKSFSAKCLNGSSH